MASITGLSVVSLNRKCTREKYICNMQTDVEPMLQPGIKCITKAQILKIQ